MKKLATRLVVFVYENWPKKRHVSKYNTRERVEKIRSTMMRMLGVQGQLRFPRLVQRIQDCPDALGLWYLRADLMAALADLHGEETARRRMDRQKNMFRGLVPQSMIARSRSRTMVMNS